MGTKTAVIVGDRYDGVMFEVPNKVYHVGEIIEVHREKYEVVRDNLYNVQVREIGNE